MHVRTKQGEKQEVANSLTSPEGTIPFHKPFHPCWCTMFLHAAQVFNPCFDGAFCISVRITSRGCVAMVVMTPEMQPPIKLVEEETICPDGD